MKLLLAVVGGVLLLLVSAAALAIYGLKRLVRSRQTGEFVESFNGNLAIPMRDCDTRRPAKEQP